jgi:hypothetical protein
MHPISYKTIFRDYRKESKKNTESHKEMPRRARIAFPSMLYQSTKGTKEHENIEEQEIREKMSRGVIGAEGFKATLEKKAIDSRRPKRGRPRK